MKKKNLVILALLLGTILLFNGCASISDSLLIAPDPAYPFQGTWLNTMSNSIQVINGINGEWYFRSTFGWKKMAVYTIEKKDNVYITSNNWRISLTKVSNNDVLSVEGMTYERYIKK